MNQARRKVIEDVVNRKDEATYRTKDKRWAWKIRGYMNKAEYWVVAYCFPIALLIWLLTGDFYKALGFWFVTQIYCLSANIRGLTLHAEGLIEWIIKKTI